jgi:hypothetical protein
MRRKSTEIVMSIAAVGLVLLVLISCDSRVRREFSVRVDSGATAQAQAVGDTARKLLMVVVRSAREQGLANTPALVFVFAGSMLLFFMTRT